MPEVDPATLAAVQKLRAREQWLRYDSIVIGQGAKLITPFWFDTFAQFADSDNLTWGGGQRTKQVGLSYTNLSGDTEDWAQLIYQTGIEFIAPLGFLGFEESLAEAAFIPQLWVNELPKRMAFSVTLQDLDTIAVVPGIHMPAGVGTTGNVSNGAGALTTIAGQTGNASVRATWTWPEPVPIAAKSKLIMSARIDKPVKELFAAMDTLPTSKTIPIPDGNDGTKDATMRNWYAIRCWHRGPRAVQLRGAYSQGAT